jgi:hypothetical protein
MEQLQSPTGDRFSWKVQWSERGVGSLNSGRTDDSPGARPVAPHGPSSPEVDRHPGGMGTSLGAMKR